MRKALLALVILFSAGLGYSQPTFNIVEDTIYQGCDSTISLSLFADSLKSTTYTYDTLPYYFHTAGGTSINMNDDQVQGPFSVGFNVSWFCGNYGQFYICSNGWIGFQATATTFSPQSIPSTAAAVPKNAIMAVWRDWNPAVTGGPYITYQTIGTAPNRKLIVTWSSVPMYSCTSTQGTFQIVVHESSNIIHTNFQNMPTCLTWVNGDGVHGVHNPTGTYGLAVTGRNDTPFTTTYETTRFIPTSPIVWVAANGDTLGIGNEFPASLPESMYVYAYGLTCNNDSVMDSVYIHASCIELLMEGEDLECTGDSSGIVVAIDTSTETAPPYTIYWMDGAGDTIQISNSNDSIDSLINVPAGTYTAFLIDAAGQFATKEYTISEPDTLFNQGVITSSDVLCFGDSTGEVVFTDTNNYSAFSGWSGLFDFYWYDANGDTIDSTIGTTSASNTLSNLPAGQYDVLAKGCFYSVENITVDEPSVLTSSIINATPVSCPAGIVCDASAQAGASGGVQPYFFLWSSGEVTQIANQLCQDSNFVTVTDANGCTSESFVIIAVPDSITTTAYSDTMICITNPASLAAASTGGTPPFSYVWTENSLTGPVVSTSEFHTAFPDTTTQYFVYSIDANGCPGDTSEVLVKVRLPLTSIIDPVDTICPYDTIDITAEAFGGDTNYTYAWSSGTFGSTATVSPDEPMWYYLTVSDFCGTPSYKDSVFVQVGGYSSISSEIRAEDDSICVGENVYLIASGRGGFRGPKEYVFTWSEASMSGNPIQFVRPTSTKEYTVTISDLCLSEPGVAKKTIYVGSPYVPPFVASPSESCVGTDVTLTFGNYMNGYDYAWNFGDGETYPNALTDSVLHRYDAPGCYDVTLSVVSDFGCFATRTEECLIKILESPTANFLHSPENPSTLSPLIKFTDRSKKAKSISWYVNGDSLSLDSVFVHEFVDTGAYTISLIAVSKDGCIDTVQKTLLNRLDQTLYIPGSFTPNGDGLNDEFLVVGEGIGLTYFELKVFDRWGNLMFQSKNPAFGWDGKSSANGELVPSGAYPYTVRYSDKNGEIRKARGQVIISSTGTYRGLR